MCVINKKKKDRHERRREKRHEKFASSKFWLATVLCIFNFRLALFLYCRSTVFFFQKQHSISTWLLLFGSLIFSFFLNNFFFLKFYLWLFLIWFGIRVCYFFFWFRSFGLESHSNHVALLCMAIFERRNKPKTTLDDTQSLICTIETAQKVNGHTVRFIQFHLV